MGCEYYLGNKQDEAFEWSEGISVLLKQWDCIFLLCIIPITKKLSCPSIKPTALCFTVIKIYAEQWEVVQSIGIFIFILRRFSS